MGFNSAFKGLSNLLEGKFASLVSR